MKTITKICTKCKAEYPATLVFWYKQKKGKYGLKSTCKECHRKMVKEYRSRPEIKEIARIRQIKWRKNNPEKSKEIDARCHNKHKEEYNKNRKIRYANDDDFRKKVKESEKKYKDSGGRYKANCKPESRRKARLRSKERRNNIEKKDHDYKQNAEWRDKNKDYLHKTNKEKRDKLAPSYIAQTMRISVNDLSPEILETQRIIIKIKRELKNNNVKIK